jgi:hypothetical protein
VLKNVSCERLTPKDIDWARNANVTQNQKRAGYQTDDIGASAVYRRMLGFD